MSDTSQYVYDNERYSDNEEWLRTVVDGFLKTFHVTYRAQIAEDSPDGHTAKATPSINGRVQMSDGSFQSIPYPTLEDLPIHHLCGGGHSTTHPTAQGDEVTLLVHSRPLDTWQQSGGQQDPIDRRIHHLGDATVLSGGRSDPNKLANVSQVSMQSRSDDGNHFYDTNKQNGLTHSSTTMVATLAGNSSGLVTTPSGHSELAPKITMNCAQG